MGGSLIRNHHHLPISHAGFTVDGGNGGTLDGGGWSEWALWPGFAPTVTPAMAPKPRLTLMIMNRPSRPQSFAYSLTLPNWVSDSGSSYASAEGVSTTKADSLQLSLLPLCDRAASTGTGFSRALIRRRSRSRRTELAEIELADALRPEEEVRDYPSMYSILCQAKVESSVTEDYPLPPILSALGAELDWLVPGESTSDASNSVITRPAGLRRLRRTHTFYKKLEVFASSPLSNYGAGSQRWTHWECERLDDEEPSASNSGTLPLVEYQRHTTLSYSRIPVSARGANTPLAPRSRRSSPEKKAHSSLRKLPSERDIQREELGSTQPGRAKSKIRRHPTSPASFGSAFASFSFTRRSAPTMATSSSAPLLSNAPKPVFDLTPPAEGQIADWFRPTLSDQMEHAPASLPRSRTGSPFSPAGENRSSPLAETHSSPPTHWAAGGEHAQPTNSPQSTTVHTGGGLQQAAAGSSSQIPPYAPHISQLPDEELDSLPMRTEYLYEEFKNSSDETPLAHRCGELVSQSLSKFDFLDLGSSTDSDGKRFRLRQTTVSSIVEVMELLQLTIDEMCKLTRARKIYQVDPKGVIRDALTKGRDTIREMMWAHHFLKTRLEGGVRTIDKLYLRDSGYNHNSPASSASSLWAGFHVESCGVEEGLPDEDESKAMEEAFAGMPEKGTARFWNRLTGQISIVGASSYGLGEDWEPPVNYFQGRSERRARSGGGVNEVRFQAGPSSTRDESSYAYQEASATPLASSQPPLPSTTPAKRPASGFLATSTPFTQGVGRSGAFNDSFSFARQSPPHMSRTNVPPPAVAAGGEQSAFGQNTLS
ncbi:hypothetical protein DFH06DRAFT_1122928 [Mycena polygramma]|nr:hypothetical protein DFH06DRAFT_1122928 [Mycena polygramma]